MIVELIIVLFILVELIIVLPLTVLELISESIIVLFVTLLESIVQLRNTLSNMLLEKTAQERTVVLSVVCRLCGIVAVKVKFAVLFIRVLFSVAALTRTVMFTWNIVLVRFPSANILLPVVGAGWLETKVVCGGYVSLRVALNAVPFVTFIVIV